MNSSSPNSAGSAVLFPPPPPIELFIVLPDGSCIPATADRARIVLKLARSEAHKARRAKAREKAVELQCAMEDRAAARRLLIELAELGRRSGSTPAVFRAKVAADAPARRTSGVRKAITGSPSRPALIIAHASSWVVDDRGMRGVHYAQSYLGRNSSTFYPGAARDFWEYVARDEAVMRDPAGEPIIISNLGDDIDEIGAAWEMIEAATTRKNGKVQIRIIVAFDADATQAEQVGSLKLFCESVLKPLGLPYAAAAHEPSAQGDQRNGHGHILLSFRQAERIAPYTLAFAREIRSELDGRDGVRMLRDLWAHAMSEAAERAGRDMRYTGLGHGARGLDLEPGVHLGEGLMAMVRRGEPVPAFERNRIKAERNRHRLIMRDLDRKIAALTRLRDTVLDQQAAAVTAPARVRRSLQPVLQVQARLRLSTAMRQRPAGSLLTKSGHLRFSRQSLMPPAPRNAAAVAPGKANERIAPAGNLEPGKLTTPVAAVEPCRPVAAAAMIKPVSTITPAVSPLAACSVTQRPEPLAATMSPRVTTSRLPSHGQAPSAALPLDVATVRPSRANLSATPSIRPPAHLTSNRGAAIERHYLRAPSRSSTDAPALLTPAHVSAPAPDPFADMLAAIPSARLARKDASDRQTTPDALKPFAPIKPRSPVPMVPAPSASPSPRSRRLGVSFRGRHASGPQRTLAEMPERTWLERNPFTRPDSGTIADPIASRQLLDALQAADFYAWHDGASRVSIEPGAARALKLKPAELDSVAGQAALASLHREQQLVFAQLIAAATKRPLAFAKTGKRPWPRDLDPELLAKFDRWSGDEGFEHDLFFKVIQPVADAHRTQAGRERDAADTSQVSPATTATKSIAPVPDGFGGLRTTPASVFAPLDLGGARVHAFDRESGEPTDQLLLLARFAGEQPRLIDRASDGRLMAFPGAPTMPATLLAMWRHDEAIDSLVTRIVTDSRAAARPVWPPRIEMALRAQRSIGSTPPAPDFSRGPSK